MQQEHHFRKFLCFLLVALMVIQTLPLEAFAATDEPIIATDENGTPLEIVNDGRADKGGDPETGEDRTILGELDDQRDEYEKHFRLSDGSNMAVSYPIPVHYEENGEWEDIDNTLQLSSEKLCQGYYHINLL